MCPCDEYKHMGTFITKPIIFEANQWFPPSDGRHDPVLTPVSKAPFLERKIGDIAMWMRGQSPEEADIYSIKLSTTENVSKLWPGAWIVKFLDGSFDVKPDNLFQVCTDKSTLFHRIWELETASPCGCGGMRPMVLGITSCPTILSVEIIPLC
jgi:hypothetical protein